MPDLPLTSTHPLNQHTRHLKTLRPNKGHSFSTPQIRHFPTNPLLTHKSVTSTQIRHFNTNQSLRRRFVGWPSLGFVLKWRMKVRDFCWFWWLEMSGLCGEVTCLTYRCVEERSTQFIEFWQKKIRKKFLQISNFLKTLILGLSRDWSDARVSLFSRLARTQLWKILWFDL